MNRLIAWCAANHVVANLLMGFAVLAGIAALSRLPVQTLPDVEVPIVVVTVPYLGAAPEEVESGVCARVEESVVGILGIREVRSISDEGVCTVQLHLFFDADSPRVLGEVETQVNAIDTFPEETERPIVRVVTFANVVAEVAVTGPSDERTLKELGRRVRDDLLRQPGIAQARVVNTRPYEISVEVSQGALLRNRLTFDDVAAAVRQRSVDLPGGAIKTDQRELLLRTSGQAYTGRELEELVLTARDDGTRVLLKDVARVVDGFADTSQALRFDGRPAALVQVVRVGGQDLREVAGAVRQYVAESASRYPDGVELTLWNDESTLLSDRLGALADNALQGLLLVLVLLALFLRPHLAVWVAAGIPIAFLGAIFLVYWLGYSIDSISVIGFILALGMLVDDAVVVGESVFAAHREGAGQLSGAIRGAQRVALPVTFGVLTTAAAFVPLLFVVGAVGEVLAVTSAVVLCCLAWSLIECGMVLPAHLGHRSARMPMGEFGVTFLVAVVLATMIVTPDLRSGSGVAVGAAALVFAAHVLGGLRSLETAFVRMQGRFESALTWFLENVFRRLVARALDARHWTLAVAAVALASTVSLIASGHLPFSFIPPSPVDRVVARITMPLGASEQDTREMVTGLARAGQRLQEELAAGEEEPPISHILESMGSQPSANAGTPGQPEAVGSHLGEVTLQLTPSGERSISTEEVARRWREAVGTVPGAAQLAFVTDRLGAGNDLNLRIYGGDVEVLRAVAAAIRRELEGYPGLSEITDSFRAGKEEVRLSVTPTGEALGITLADLGRQVRQAFYGEEAQRIQRGRDDVRVMVRYTEEDRRSLHSLYALRIRTPDGGDAPFGTVAEVETGRGTSTIVRTQGQRSINVTAGVELAVTSAGAVLSALEAQFLPALLADYPGVSYSVENVTQQQETAASLVPLFLIALFAIFALLAIPLRSYAQPLIIMAVLPFALVGAVWGHALMKTFGQVTGLSMPSVFGVVAASGVVINATLILMHGANQYRAAGDALGDALCNAAVSRFRPILITSVTTFAGLTPLMLSTGAATQTLVPMAIALAFGVLFSSVAALLVVPSFWLAVHHVAAGARRATDRVGEMVAPAPRLARWMARYPYLQESLRKREFTDLQLPADLGLHPEQERVARRGLVRVYYEREFGVAEMRAQLGAIAAQAPSADDLVREARSWAEQRTFQLGVHMVGGVIAPVEAARPLSDILDTCLGALLAAAKAELAAEEAEIPEEPAALVAFGALARREFATGGPLELLLLYERDSVPAGGGPSGQVWHTRLMRRLSRLVGAMSPEGILYEARIAPPLPGARDGVCSLAALGEHFSASPSVPDLRMLTHARVIAGEGELVAGFEACRQSALARSWDRVAVGVEFRRARARSADRHDAADVWDVRHRPGGLADLELAAEYLQLIASEGAVAAGGLAATFEAAAEQGVIDSRTATDLSRAAALWHNLDGLFRMACNDAFRPEMTSPQLQGVIADTCGVGSFDALPEVMDDTAGRAATRIDAMLANAPGVAR